jgi:hypothetical protein
MATRLSESLSVTSESSAITTQITLSSSESTEKTILAALGADWGPLVSLEGMAIHRSLSADCLLAHCQWRGSITDALRGTEALTRHAPEAVTNCLVEQHVLTLHSLRRGRAQGNGDFTLNINSHSDRPVLIAAFEPTNRNSLLDYLHEASARFTEHVEGWHGAALYCDIDNRRVVEYLQFQSMAGVAASQASPLIQQHQIALQKLGTMRANLYMVQDVYRRRVD